MLMSTEEAPRVTIADVDPAIPLEEMKKLIVDSGRRRHLSWHRDFDTRSAILATKIEEHWEDPIKAMWIRNQQDIRAALLKEYGELQIEEKIKNFIAIGTKPFSILAYHNAFFDQVRRAFVIGSYYPALTGACSLGERILNHIILDLRDQYKHTPEYKHVHRKSSFDDWRVPINALEAWGMLLPKAVTEFRALHALRNRSIHFRLGTYSTLREDALAAVLHMREIIEQQFGSFGPHPWFIPGTAGQVFIKKEFEKNPFVRAYFLTNCPFVGPLFSIDFVAGSPRFNDFLDYGDGIWSDDEFAAQFNERDPNKLAKPKAAPS
jgi:hypothetical protein